MPTSSSDESEILTRRTTRKSSTSDDPKPKKKAHLEHLFSSSDESSYSTAYRDPDVRYTEHDTLLYEIFGDGTDYQHIYNHDTIPSITSTASPIPEYNGPETYDCSDHILSYISMRPSLVEREKEVLYDLLCGKSIHFVFLHKDCPFSFFELLKIKNRLRMYKKSKIVYDELGSTYKDLDCVFRFFVTPCEMYKIVSLERKLHGILISPCSLYENYLSNLKIYVPLEDDCVGGSYMVESCVDYFVEHPFFVNMVCDFVVKHNERHGDADMEYLYRCTDFAYIESLFVVGNKSYSDCVREKFIKTCIRKLFEKNEFRSEFVKFRKEKVRECRKMELVNEIADRVLNGGVSSDDIESGYCFGVFARNNVYHCSVVNEMGIVVCYFTFSTLRVKDEDRVVWSSSVFEDMLVKYKPFFVGFVGNDKSVKYGIKNINEIVERICEAVKFNKKQSPDINEYAYKNSKKQNSDINEYTYKNSKKQNLDTNDINDSLNKNSKKQNSDINEYTYKNSKKQNIGINEEDNSHINESIHKNSDVNEFTYKNSDINEENDWGNDFTYKSNDEYVCRTILVENDFINVVSSVSDPKSYCTTICHRLLSPEYIVSLVIEKSILPLSTKKYLNFLTRTEIIETMKIGLKVALSFIGIDVNSKAVWIGSLMKVINLNDDFNVFLSENGYVYEIKELENVMSKNILENNHSKYTENEPYNNFDNAAVFLRINTKKEKGKYAHEKGNVLDSTMVHPINHNFTRILCSTAVAYEENKNNSARKNENKNVEYVLNNPDQILDLGIAGIDESKKTVINIIQKQILYTKRKQFICAPDNLIFYECIKGAENVIYNKIYEGRIIRIGKTFYIIQAKIDNSQNNLLSIRENNESRSFDNINESYDIFFVDVFVKKEREMYNNQLVNIKIHNIKPKTLCFEGEFVEIEEKSKNSNLKFTSHHMFRNLNSKEAEKYLCENNKIIVLRKSGSNDDAIITTKIELGNNEKIFIHTRINEINSNDNKNTTKYLLKDDNLGNEYFEKIDEIVSTHIKGTLKNIKQLKNHKRFCLSKEKTYEYLSKNGGYGKIVYAFYLSREYPGYLAFTIKTGDKYKNEYVKIGRALTYDKKEFNSIDEFISYRKNI